MNTQNGTTSNSILDGKLSGQNIPDITKRDPVSGCHNNTSFMKQYNDIFSFRNDIKGPLHADEQGMLILIDICNFDLIENVYGRSVALNCLREMGSTLVNFLSEKDFAGRLRAGEFAVVLRQAGMDRCLERLHALMRDIRDLHIKARSIQIDLKIDIGLKPYKPGDSAISIMAGADMYKQTMIEEDRHLEDNSGSGKTFNHQSNRGNDAQETFMSTA